MLKMTKYWRQSGGMESLELKKKKLTGLATSCVGTAFQNTLLKET